MTEATSTDLRCVQAFSDDVFWENFKPVLGVLRETHGMWERRCPLSPIQVREFVNEGVRVVVQPSTRRVYPDSAYEEVGVEIKEDISDATIIVGVKPVTISNLLPNRAYFMFSHTMKAQPENMEMLDACIDRNISLFDYECIVNEEGKRLLAFGKFAGMVGRLADGTL
mmetsp:Transcript_58676/g.117851  ORF Transcript_58676/g.117851 Transcript_58676/m.117851 type:complete len:168 (-) Transcript_58676:521-1024(-)